MRPGCGYTIGSAGQGRIQVSKTMVVSSFASKDESSAVSLWLCYFRSVASLV